jgi:hypothetical protein
VRDLGQVAIGEGFALQRLQHKKAVDQAFFVAHAYGFPVQSAKDEAGHSRPAFQAAAIRPVSPGAEVG